MILDGGGGKEKKRVHRGAGGGGVRGRRGGRLATAEEVTYPPTPNPQLYLLPEPITVAEIPQD